MNSKKRTNSQTKITNFLSRDAVVAKKQKISNYVFDKNAKKKFQKNEPVYECYKHDNHTILAVEDRQFIIDSSNTVIGKYKDYTVVLLNESDARLCIGKRIDFSNLALCLTNE